MISLQLEKIYTRIFEFEINLWQADTFEKLKVFCKDKRC